MNSWVALTSKLSQVKLEGGDGGWTCESPAWPCLGRTLNAELSSTCCDIHIGMTQPSGVGHVLETHQPLASDLGEGSSRPLLWVQGSKV